MAMFSLSSRGSHPQVGGSQWQKEIASRKKLTSSQQKEEIPTKTVVGAAQTAMEETQKRAAADKEKALAEMRAGKSEALGEDYTGWKGAVSDLPSKQLGEDYTGWKSAIDEMGTGEYDEDIKEAMHAKSVIPIESQTQQMIKDIQRSYYGGGTPGGMQQMLTQQAKLSKIGQVGGLRRDIEIESENARQRAMGIKAGRMGELAGYSGGVHGQQAGRMGELARYKGGVATGTASKLADILGHTITAVPDYSSVPAVSSPSDGGTTTTRSGGSMRSAPRSTTSRSPGGVTWAKTKPGEPRRMTSAFGRSVGFG